MYSVLTKINASIAFSFFTEVKGFSGIFALPLQQFTHNHNCNNEQRQVREIRRHGEI